MNSRELSEKAFKQKCYARPQEPGKRCLRRTQGKAGCLKVLIVVFGLFWLTGYQFSPRIAGIGEARYPLADYYF